MMVVLWSGLNIVLLVFVVYAWIRVLKVLWRAIGFGLALLFLLSLTSKVTHSPDGGSQNLLASSLKTARLVNWIKITPVRLSPVNSLQLVFEGQEEATALQINGLYVTISGLQLGHYWKAVAGTASVGPGGVAYQAHMVHQWLLLGVSVYTSSESYTGTVPAR